MGWKQYFDMTQDAMIRKIADLTRDWTLGDWNNLRDEEYWRMKDKYHRLYWDGKKWNYGAYARWIQWKLTYILEYELSNYN